MLLRLNELDAPILGHHVLNPKVGTVQNGIASPKEGYTQQSKVYAFICLTKKLTPQHDGNSFDTTAGNTLDHKKRVSLEESLSFHCFGAYVKSEMVARGEMRA